MWAMRGEMCDRWRVCLWGSVRGAWRVCVGKCIKKCGEVW